MLLYGGLLQAGGTAEQQAEHIPAIIDGSRLGAFASLERQSRFDLAAVTPPAAAEGGNYRLNGEKVVVFNGANADYFIVSARTGGEQSDEQGISLFLVAADAPGVERISYRMMDGQLVANLVLRDVVVATANLVGEADGGYPLMEPVILQATIALGEIIS